jgi:lysophospholipase L1-like esterase
VRLGGCYGARVNRAGQVALWGALACSAASVACSRRDPVQDATKTAPTAASAVAPLEARPSSSGSPCPTSRPCRILPLGDSITFGLGGSPGGYRVPLFRISREKKHEIVFVGRVRSGPSTVDGAPFSPAHEGYSGYTVAPCGGREGLAPLVDGALSTEPPDVVLLMIGTNDVAVGCDLAASAKALEAIVDRVAERAPSATTIVASLVPTQSAAMDLRGDAYVAEVAKLVEARAARGVRIRYADMRAAFATREGYRTQLLADLVHPNDAGYAVMAEVWAKVVWP